MATIPATATADAPAIGFVAHVDTSPEMPGANVKPIVHRDWDGSDIVLPGRSRPPSCAPRIIPDLAAQIGHDIVTASGTTLLGADDKAGVAVIVAAAEHLMAHPEIPHGAIRVGFTPDEEIGRGANLFDVARFGADCAYTLDGGNCGELEFESFSADAMRSRSSASTRIPATPRAGWSTRSRRRRASSIACRRIGCRRRRPTDTKAIVHPYQFEASVDRTSVACCCATSSRAAARQAGAGRADRRRDGRARTGTRVEFEVDEQYRNMREVLDRHPDVVERARRRSAAPA